MFKKFFSLSLVLLCTMFILGGCGKATYNFSENTNGSISIDFKIELDTEAILNGGGSQEFINDVLDVASATLENYKNNSMSKYYLKIGTTYPSPSEIKNWYLNDAVICDVEKKDNTVNFNMTFFNSEVYYFFYGITEEDIKNSNDENIIEKHWLYNKVIQKSSTIYSNSIDTSSGNVNVVKYYNDEMYKYIKNNYSKELADKFNKLELTYSYSTSNTKLRADADKKLIGDGYNTFVWNIDNNNLDREITFYRIVPNSTSFYILGLGLTLVFGLIYFIISFVKSKREEKLKIEKINKFKNDLDNLSDKINEVIDEK